MWSISCRVCAVRPFGSGVSAVSASVLPRRLFASGSLPAVTGGLSAPAVVVSTPVASSVVVEKEKRWWERRLVAVATAPSYDLRKIDQLFNPQASRSIHRTIPYIRVVDPLRDVADGTTTNVDVFFFPHGSFVAWGSTPEYDRVRMGSHFRVWGKVALFCCCWSCRSFC
jgi:hypothetical protein